MFGWDGDEKKPAPALPIPGCTETSLCDRMSDAECGTRVAEICGEAPLAFAK